MTLNYTGNVGKSTLVENLLFPRLENAEIISFETINSNNYGDDVEQLTGDEFGRLIRELGTYQNAIIDVGSSNMESFMEKMVSYKNSCQKFDLFIIPCIGKEKQVDDTINTIISLNQMGVDSQKIIPIFNEVRRNDKIEKTFAELFNYHELKTSFNLKNDAVISHNEIYGYIKDTGKTISDLANDETDYTALIAEQAALLADIPKPERRKSKVHAELMRLGDLEGNKMLAQTVIEELDTVFNAIMK